MVDSGENQAGTARPPRNEETAVLPTHRSRFETRAPPGGTCTGPRGRVGERRRAGVRAGEAVEGGDAAAAVKKLWFLIGPRGPHTCGNLSPIISVIMCVIIDLVLAYALAALMPIYAILHLSSRPSRT